MKKAGNLIGLRFTETNIVCPKHNRKKIKVPRGAFKNVPQQYLEPFCLECFEEKREQELDSFRTNMFINETTGFLSRVSLLPNKSELSHTFDNFNLPTIKNNDNIAIVEQKNACIEALKEAKKLAQKYVDEPESSFNTLMFGKAGTGKTHLAIAMLNYINKNSKPRQRCLFLSLNLLLEKRQAHVENAENNNWDNDYLRKIVSKADVVVVDDLGAETPNHSSYNQSGASNFTQKAINIIYDSNARVITTTNYSLKDFYKTYDQRLVSRILSNAKGHMIDFSKVVDYRIFGGKWQTIVIYTILQLGQWQNIC